MGVGQEFTFSPILSALYITPIFHILEKKNLSISIPISFMFFVNGSLLIS